MISDGVKPVGRLLTELVQHADLAKASRYLRDSVHSEVKKDILLHADKYSADQVRGAVNSVPDHFFAAFIAMLVRCGGQRLLGDFNCPSWFSYGANTQTKLHRLRLHAALHLTK